MKDGEPFACTPDEMARIVAGEDPTVVKAEPTTVPLTEIERASLAALITARESVQFQIERYITEAVCSRLGLSRNRVANIDCAKGEVTLASGAPK